MSSSPFLVSIREHMLVRRYSLRTIKAYLYWIKYFVVFNGKRHPSELGANHVERFLTYLAIDRSVSASTQATALNAIAFLYNKFLDKPLGDIGQFRKSNRQAKLPVVLTQTEVQVRGQFSNSYQFQRILPIPGTVYPTPDLPLDFFSEEGWSLNSP